MERSRRRRRLLGGASAGALAGIATGIVLATAAPGAQTRYAGEPDVAERSLIDAAHVPAVLTVPGEPVRLRYALICPGAGSGPIGDEPCDGSGDVYLRAGGFGPFTRLPLARSDDSVAGRYVLDVPPAFASSPSGFSYYAVLRNDATGAELTLPAGGAAAPQRSYPLAGATTIRLEAHHFGAGRSPDARVVDARWGSGTGEVGLAGGSTSLRIGPSSFDIAPDGAVTMLDESNRRLLRFARGRVSSVAVDLDGPAEGLAVTADRTIFVLDARERPPVLRHFGRDGALIGRQELRERTATQLQMGPAGPIVQQQPSEQWMPLATGAGRMIDRVTQAREGRSGRPLADGSELVVAKVGAAELRLARVSGGEVRQAWRILSETPLGEVQLAEPLGSRVLVVMKAYSDSADEFVVLVLDARGVVRQFSVDSAEWAESAPLGRFRLAGDSLFRLGSSPTGAFVDRFDLEVIR